MDMIFDNWNLIFGVILVVLGIGLLVKDIYERSHGTRCKGNIIGFERGERGYLFPVVKFVYEGEEYSMSTSNGSQKPKKGIGEEMEVVYYPKNQKQVMEVGNHTDKLICLVVIALGAAMLASYFLG